VVFHCVYLHDAFVFEVSRMDVMVQEAELCRLAAIRCCPQCKSWNGFKSVESSEQSRTEKTEHRYSKEVEPGEDLEE